MIDTNFQLVATIICAALASSGLWTFIQVIYTQKNSKKDLSTEMLIGLGHDRIIYLGMKYIERGWITQDEYENLYDYLYVPYSKLGGNGSAKKIITEVQKLPIKSSTHS